MAVHTPEAAQLVLDGDQVLKGAKGGGRQVELALETEVAHVNLCQLRPGPDLVGLIGEFLAAHCQHR